MAELRLAFSSEGVDGSVAVTMSTTTDPDGLGFDLVAPGLDLARVVGFPVVTATVDYPAGGYRAVLAWLQVLVLEYADGSAPQTMIDTFPSLAGFPFVALGAEPTYFDAPSNPDHPDMRWSARAFLVRPHAHRQEVRPVTGFSWGYRLTSGRPTPIAPAPAGEADWRTFTTSDAFLATGWRALEG